MPILIAFCTDRSCDIDSVSWTYNSLLVPIAMSSMCFLCVSRICSHWLAPLSFWSSIHAVGKGLCSCMLMWDLVSRHSWIVYGISFTCFAVSHKRRALDLLACDLCGMGPKLLPQELINNVCCISGLRVLCLPRKRSLLHLLEALHLPVSISVDVSQLLAYCKGAAPMWSAEVRHDGQACCLCYTWQPT